MPGRLPFKHIINSFDSDYDSEGWSDARGKCPVPLLSACFSYSAEGGGFDCSIDDGYSLNLPPNSFVERLGLRWTGSGADFIDEQDSIVAFDPTAHEDGPSALLIREDAMNRFLTENDLALCWTIVGEKMVSRGSRQSSKSQVHQTDRRLHFHRSGRRRIREASDLLVARSVNQVTPFQPIAVDKAYTCSLTSILRQRMTHGTSERRRYEDCLRAHNTSESEGGTAKALAPEKPVPVESGEQTDSRCGRDGREAPGS